LESESVEGGLRAGMPYFPGFGWYWSYPGAPAIFTNPVEGLAFGYQWGLYSVDSPIVLQVHPSQISLTRWEIDEQIRAGVVEMVPFGLIPV